MCRRSHEEMCQSSKQVDDLIVRLRKQYPDPKKMLKPLNEELGKRGMKLFTSISAVYKRINKLPNRG